MSFSEWREVKLGEIINLNYGKGLSATKRNPGNIPVYSSAGITGWHDKALIKKNGIVVGRKGTVGTVYYSETPFYCIDTAYYLTEDDTKEDLKYLYYLLNHLPLKKLNTDSAVPGLNRDNAYSQVFSLPQIQEQKAIAHILSTLDDKIEVNNQINKTLENMAQAIFKQWFVDFEFPNEDGEPYKSSGGEMVESELGMIPEGWGVGILNDISSNIITGKTPSTKDSSNFNGNIPFVKIPDMHGKVYVTKTETYLSENGAVENKIIPPNSIIVSCIATPGLVCLASEKCQTNQQINTIINKDKKMSYFTYFLLNSLSEHIRTLGSTGSATLNLNKGQFSKIKVVIPDSVYTNLYFDIVDPLFKEILINMTTSEKLSNTRDLLLPKLMSGEIRVPLDEEGDAS